MRNKVLIVAILAVVMVTCLVGCEAPKTDSYTIPMIDLDEGVIKSGMVDEDHYRKSEILYTFDEELTAYPDMFAKDRKLIVADKSDFGMDYMAHPDSILLRRKAKGGQFEFGNEVLTVFPLGHGKGEIKAKINAMYTDPKVEGAKPQFTYDNKKGATTLTNTPASWKRSQETPVVYRLVFSDNNVSDDNDLLILTAGNPRWPGDSSYKANGFNVSISAPSQEGEDMVEGRVWSEFETWYGHGKDAKEPNTIVREPQGTFEAIDPIVAMSSLTRLKENGVWADKWMGLFHDHNFHCYKTILEFKTKAEVLNDPEMSKKYTAAELDSFPKYTVENEQKMMFWSTPVRYYDAFRSTELKSQMCEVECIRSDGGKGDELMLITRSNSKKMSSLMIISKDEGKTWSQPREVPFALSGERHKAEWIKVNGEDKLFITFRSVERGTDKNKYYSQAPLSWTSEGYVAWVGSWDDIVNGREGDFRVKIAHTFLNGDSVVSRNANGDTGYAGNAVMLTANGEPTSKVWTCSYGMFSPANDANRGGQTYIVGRMLDVSALYELVSKAK